MSERREATTNRDSKSFHISLRSEQPNRSCLQRDRSTRYRRQMKTILAEFSLRITGLSNKNCK